MLYREIIAVCSQIRTKHINTLRRQNVELLNVKLGGTYSDHYMLILVTHRVLPLHTDSSRGTTLTYQQNCYDRPAVLQKQAILSLHLLTFNCGGSE